MTLVDTPPADEARVSLRLYVARSTPNSVRAEYNLSVVLDSLKDELQRVDLEIIDVFAQPKRAITAGVVVTPSLIGSAADTRILLMGDLADRTEVRRVLENLLRATP